MQRSKILLSLLLGFISTSYLSIIVSNKISILSVNASKPPINTFKFEGILRENMAQLLGVEEKQVKSTKIERTNWQDCLPTPSQSKICKQLSLSGFRVTMSGQGENWVYYVTDAGSITLDNRASLNKAIRSNLAKELAIQPNQLKIAAVQLITTSSCTQNTKNCKPKPSVEWRILANGREQPLQIKLNGKPSNLLNFLESRIPKSTSKMPREFAFKALKDVANRDGILTANLRIESIKATTWNWCRGGGVGPTPPDMGACPDINQPGWQMIVVSGSNRYIYYIPQAAATNPSSYQIAPDGMQSLPKLARETVIKNAAKQANVLPNMMSIKFAEPKFFDGCLNTIKETITCSNSIQGGWQVTALGGKLAGNSPPVLTSATWIYNVYLTGNQAKFVQSSTWFPKP
jgi:hypothetical protein